MAVKATIPTREHENPKRASFSRIVSGDSAGVPPSAVVGSW
jgi:hypothetical protein